jgi:transposase
MTVMTVDEALLNILEVDDEPIRRLTLDLLEAAERLTPAEVRYLVDTYYQVQEARKAAGNRLKAAERAGEPTLLLDHFHENLRTVEGQIKRAMLAWAPQYRPGRWMLDQYGIGPVLASGFLAHLDIEQAPTVGHFWAFAGLDPTRRWERGQRRPHNATLKVLCWRLGDCVKKFSGNPRCVYGQLYRRRKALEVERNERLMFADQAAESLRRERLTDRQRAWYEKGMLPPARIDLRAMRWAVKVFLAHLHHVMWEDRYGTPPPRPYVLDRLGHTTFIAPPGWPRE